MGQRKDPLLPETWYHCYNRGVDKRVIFEDTNDYERFLMLLRACNSVQPVHISNFEQSNRSKTLYDVLRVATEKPLVDIGAYNLMGTHYHLLLREREANGITSCMRKIGTAYTMYFNIRRERTGALFEGAFKAKRISTDQYFDRVLSYIHANHAEIVEPNWKVGVIKNEERLKKHLVQYRFSSLPDYSKESRPESVIINKQAVFETTEKVSSLGEIIEEARIYARDNDDSTGL